MTPVLVGVAILLINADSAWAAISTTGNVTPDPSTTTSDDALYIGRTADGTMTVDAGSIVDSRWSYLGYNTGATGTATITGSNSIWNSGFLTVGGEGTGQLTIIDGGNVNSTDGSTIGSDFSSLGTVTVSGANSQWTISRNLSVAFRGTGSLMIADGADLSTTSASVGNEGGSGTVVVTGTGSKWDSGSLSVGSGGSGEVTITAGGKVTTGGGAIGDRGSMGTVNVKGTHSHWGISSSLNVDRLGKLMITDGAEASTTTLAGRAGSGISGAVVVAGTGSRLISTSSIDIGGSGGGSIMIEDGGTVLTGFGAISRSPSAVGTLTITGSSSSWTSTSDFVVGEFGTGVLGINGGMAHVANDTYLGRQGTGNGEVRFNGGTLNTGGLLARFSDLHGTGTIVTHGIVSDIDLIFNTDNGFQRQIVVANAPNEDVKINLDASAAGSMGAGYRGQGSLTIADGLNVASRDGILGYHDTAIGNVNVNGASSAWTLDGSLSVGDRGMGILTLAEGGSVVVAGSTHVARASNLPSRIQFDYGTLTTQTLFASPDQLAGNGVINARGIVSDINLVIDQSHPIQQPVTLNSVPNQSIIINLNLDGTGALGAGYRGEGSLTISDRVAVASTSGYLGVRPGSKGIATVAGEGSSWTMSGELQVGQIGSRGELTIADGADVSDASVRIVGGKVTVTGSGSTWTNIAGLVIQGTSNQTAELLIENGGRVSSMSQFGAPPFRQGIALAFSSNGEATVTGPGSVWTHTGSLVVGGDGTGVLTISHGGRVSSTEGIVSAGCATCNSGSGTVTVTGSGSTWTNDGSLTVGRGRPGMLTISNGGFVYSTTGAIATELSTSGTVVVSGDGSHWTITDALTIGGDRSIGGTLNIGPGAIVSVGGETLIHSRGRLYLEGGTLGSASIRFLSTGGQFNWTSGTVHVGQYNGNLTNSAGVLAPGQSAGSTTITGTYMQQAAATLQIEIGGTLPTSQHDFVDVLGAVTLGGQLQLSLIDGFVPGPENIFTVLTATGNITGAFSNIASGQRLSTTDGLGSFLVHYGAGSAFNPRQVVLTGFQSIPEPTIFALFCALLLAGAFTRVRTK